MMRTAGRPRDPVGPYTYATDGGADLALNHWASKKPLFDTRMPGVPSSPLIRTWCHSDM